MKLFQLICYYLYKNRWGYILLSVELFITALIFISFLGKLQYTHDTSEIANTFQGSNSFYFTPHPFYDEEKLPLRDVLANSTDFSYELGEVYQLVFSTDTNESYTAYGYNDLLIENVHIPLATGKWFEDNYPEGIIPVIALDETFEVGTTFPLEGTENTAYVIGTVKSSAYILIFHSGASKDFARLDDFIAPANAQFLVPYQSEKYANITKESMSYCSKQPGAIISVEKAEVAEEIYDICSLYGSISGISVMKENYQKDLQDFYITNGTILLVFSLLTLLGIGGFNGIQSLANERTYTIYYMLGLSKRKCMLLEGMKTVVFLLVNFGLFVFAYEKKLNQFFSNKSYHITNNTFIIVFVYLSLICMGSSVGYVYQLGKKNLIATYKQKA